MKNRKIEFLSDFNKLRHRKAQISEKKLSQYWDALSLRQQRNL